MNADAKRKREYARVLEETKKQNPVHREERVLKWGQRQPPVQGHRGKERLGEEGSSESSRCLPEVRSKVPSRDRKELQI